jgi:TldD protein
MLTRRIIEAALSAAMSTGADFAEVFVEDTCAKSVVMMDKKVERLVDSAQSGIGIRAFLGTRYTHASTSDLSERGVLECAMRVAGLIASASPFACKPLRERIFPSAHEVRIVPSSADNKARIDILRRAYDAAFAYDKAIIQVTGSFMDSDRRIQIANSDGLFTSDRQVRCRIAVSAVSSDGHANQNGFSGPGARRGLELFETQIVPEQVGKEAARIAMVNLKAGYCPAAVMPVAIDNGFGGVIFHEACGHSLEATQVAYNSSEFCGKIGKRVACDKVTAIDDGTLANEWGSIDIDDEGHPGQRNVLIENGILKGYMIDGFNSRRMGMPATGNSRRQDYTFCPTSRMTNTFIAPGPDEDKDIIASMEYGLYAAKMGGGSVNPATGAFNFAVLEGYLVRNGKIAEPVRGASLVGTGSGVLAKIDMVGKSLAHGQGMCGSSSGSLPVNVGQPMIRVSDITVGGR